MTFPWHIPDQAVKLLPPRELAWAILPLILLWVVIVVVHCVCSKDEEKKD